MYSKNKNRERVVCADGFSISIQAGDGRYCSPRLDGVRQYSQLELGFPNRPCPFIYKYAETPEDYTETIYPYVPAKVVDAMIKGHGGIVSGECPPLDLS
jgi:hypothetical protein